MAKRAARVKIEDRALLGHVAGRRLVFTFLFQDVIAQVHAFVTDVYGRAGNEFAHLILVFTAKRTDKLRGCSRFFVAWARISCLKRNGEDEP